VKSAVSNQHVAPTIIRALRILIGGIRGDETVLRKDEGKTALRGTVRALRGADRYSIDSNVCNQ
jgi:hypothetical protein